MSNTVFIGHAVKEQRFWRVVPGRSEDRDVPLSLLQLLSKNVF